MISASARRTITPGSAIASTRAEVLGLRSAPKETAMGSASPPRASNVKIVVRTLRKLGAWNA